MKVRHDKRQNSSFQKNKTKKLKYETVVKNKRKKCSTQNLLKIFKKIISGGRCF